MVCTGGKNKLQNLASPCADSVQQSLSLCPAGNRTSKETKDKSEDLERQSALSPLNHPYRNNCTLSMHELQRILVEETVN